MTAQEAEVIASARKAGVDIVAAINAAICAKQESTREPQGAADKEGLGNGN